MFEQDPLPDTLCACGMYTYREWKEKQKAEAAAKHILVRDNDGHWYVIPASKSGDWREFVKAITDYWDGGLESDKDGSAEPKFPEWAEEVGGSPSLVEFENYTIK